MKKFILSLVLVSMFTLPVVSFASTTEEYEAKLVEIRGMIAQLQELESLLEQVLHFRMDLWLTQKMRATMML